MRLFSFVTLLIAGFALLGSTACTGGATREVRTYAMGDRIVLGHLVYTVYETRWLPQIGEGPTARVPQNRFFLIRMSVGSSSNQETLIPNKTIVDDKGTSFTELSNGDGVPEWLGFLRPVTVAAAVAGNALFDAPPAHYKLQLTDESTEQRALVDIPLSFRSDGLDVPSPEVK